MNHDFKPQEIEYTLDDNIYIIYVTDFNHIEEVVYIDWIVEKETGEIVTDEWFESDIFDRIGRGLLNEVKDSKVNDSLMDALDKWV